MSESMQLCLVSNDPTSTLLVTPDGIPMYSTETSSHSLLASGFDPASHSVPQPHQRSPTTTVKRLNRYNPSIGHAETVVGVVDYGRSPSGTSVQLCDEQVQLELTIAPSTARMIADRSENNDSDEDDGGLNMENSWGFKGPNSTPYKWQMFRHSPVLLLDDNSLTPLARYRRAKLGIVSRSRRAFLEILPAGLGIIDLIVVTFVGYMRQRVMVDSGPTVATIRDSFASAAAAVGLGGISSTPSRSMSSSPSGARRLPT